MGSRSGRFARPVVFVALGAALMTMLATPVGAHVTGSVSHLWNAHIKPKLATSGTINDASNPVDWTKLKGVPAGLADGTDDTGTGQEAAVGASIRADGTVDDFFNPYGGAPTVNHAGTGIYYITFSGVPFDFSSGAVLMATPNTGSSVSTTINASTFGAQNEQIAIITKNSPDNITADRGFHVVAFRSTG